MDVTFELFAAMERQIGQSRVSIAIGEPISTIGEALPYLQRAHPQLSAAIERCACVCGDSIVKRNHPLPADAVIGLLPPVAGG